MVSENLARLCIALHTGGNVHIFAVSRCCGGLACLTQVRKITEPDIQCADPSGALLDQEGFERMLEPLVNVHGQDVINYIFTGLEAYSNLTVFPDDVSIIMVEHIGAITD